MRRRPSFLVVGLVASAVAGLWVWRLRDAATPSAVAVHTLSGEAMGTRWTVKVVEPEVAPEKLAQAVRDALEEVEAAMSTYRPTSELSRLNAHADASPFPVSAATREVLELSREVSFASGGAFDVTVAPLVEAWGFGPRGERPAPTEEELSALREAVGYARLFLTDAGVVKQSPKVRADLSAVAKGYGVDRAAAALEALGATRFLVEVGGELLSRGTNAQGQPWVVGIEAPDPTGLRVHRAVALDGGAVATSGDYRNFYVRDGQRLSHTIDPRTARPVAHPLASVTVLAVTCARADAWATALNVLGPVEGPVAARREGLEALFLVHLPDGGLGEVGTGRFEALEHEG